MLPEESSFRTSEAMKRILGQTPAWLSGGGEHADVVLSSRVRLARNLAGFRFVGRAEVQERRDVFNLVRKNLTKAGIVSDDPGSGGSCWLDVSTMDQYTRDALSERQCISRQHAKGHKTSANEGPDPRAVIVQTPDEAVSIMVNEEDHLRLRAVRPGLMLREALQEIGKVDDQIESVLEYAFSSRFGYLTACPTNVGTGIRVSVMMHLPALRILGEIDRVKRAASDMSLALRGFWGEGSEADGDFYQLSNQTTLGKSEELILNELSSTIVPKVIEYERRAREKLLTQRREFTEDVIYRAIGTLTHARRIAADEAMCKLSEVRLGVSLGVMSGPDIATVNRLLLMVQQAHLQHAVGRVLEPGERKAARASMLRQALSEER